MSRTRCWILSERVLGVDLVERALGLYVEEGRILVTVPLDEAREFAAAGLTGDGSVPSYRPTEPPRRPGSNGPAMSAEEEGGRTTTDVRRRSLETRSAPIRVHDFGGRPVVPAFVNGHAHLGMAPLRGITSRAARSGDVVKDVFFQIEEHLTADDVLAFTRLAGFECLLAGVGEVWDHYYYGEAIAQALLEVGLTGTVAPTLQDLSGPGAGRAEDELEATHLIASSTRLRAFGISAALGIHASDTASDDLLARAGDLARNLRLPVHLHFLQSQAEFEHAQQSPRRRPLLDFLADTQLVVAHALFATRSEVAALCAAKATLAFCPLSQAQFGFLGPIEDWLEAGGGFALGTDSVASNDSLDVQRELALTANLAGLRAGHGAERERFFQSGDPASARALEERRRELVSRSQLLEPSTVLGAAWGLHLPGGPRGIQPGAPANLLVLDPDHPALFPADDLPRLLVHASVAPAIHQMLIHGQPVAEGGHFQASLLGRDEYRSALGEASARRRELQARSGLT